MSKNQNPWHKMDIAIYGLGLLPSRIAVYGAIRRYTNSAGTAYPKRKTIATMAGVCIRTVDKAVKELQARGILEKEYRFEESTEYGRRQTSNNYKILPMFGTEQPTNPVKSGGANVYTPPEQDFYTGGAQMFTPQEVGFKKEDFNELDLRETAMPSPSSSSSSKFSFSNKKEKHGEYNNVYLSEEDMTLLKTKYTAAEVSAGIERLSEYLETSGKKYYNHAVILIKWLREGIISIPKQITGNKKSRFCNFQGRGKEVWTDIERLEQERIERMYPI